MNGEPLFTAEDFEGVTDSDSAADIANSKHDTEMERLRDESLKLKIRAQGLERTVDIVSGGMDSLRAASADIYRKQEADNEKLRARVANLESHIHTCHPDCNKAGCVNTRLREALEYYARGCGPGCASCDHLVARAALKGGIASD